MRRASFPTLRVAISLSLISTLISCSGSDYTAEQTSYPITVAVRPPAATVTITGGVQFTAAVTAYDKTVTWSVLEGPAGGTVSAAGLYFSPNAVGTYHVVATSRADTTKSAMGTVTAVDWARIYSFKATGPAIITAGGSTTLAGVFSGGTGVIDNSVGTIVSGVDVTVSPIATTKYTLTVTNAAGESFHATATITVM